MLKIPKEKKNIEVDLSDEDEWTNSIELLVEHADVPIFFGDARTPTAETPAYRRWQRRLLNKLAKQIDEPKPPPEVEPGFY